MADFKIVVPVPFEVEGATGTVYQLPLLDDLSSEQIAAMGELSKVEQAYEDDIERTVERTNAIKRFMLVLCPALADEPLSDMAFTNMFNALCAKSGVELGES